MDERIGARLADIFAIRDDDGASWFVVARPLWWEPDFWRHEGQHRVVLIHETEQDAKAQVLRIRAAAVEASKALLSRPHPGPA